jgi:GT2 family glycosyltransferase
VATAPVAVLIVNYNSGPMLGRCLDALARQTWREFRVVVVDNASSDGSGVAIEGRYPNVALVRSAANLGFAGGNNLGLRHAGEARWIVLLNPDAFPEPDWLERLMAAAQAHAQFAFFGCRMMAAETPELLDGIGDVFHVSGMHWREGHHRKLRADDLQPREIFAPCAAAAMYRRDVLEEAGGFDEDYFCYAEDVDLGFRLRLAGHRAMYVADAVVLHVGSAITGRRSDFSVYHGHRNLIWTYAKDMPGALAWLFLPWHIAINLAALGVLLLRGQGGIALRAKIDALRGLPRMLKKRRSIQAARRVAGGALLVHMARGWPDRRRGWSRPLS